MAEYVDTDMHYLRKIKDTTYLILTNKGKFRFGSDGREVMKARQRDTWADDTSPRSRPSQGKGRAGCCFTAWTPLAFFGEKNKIVPEKGSNETSFTCKISSKYIS